MSVSHDLRATLDDTDVPLRMQRECRKVSGATKPATLETGLVVQVPLFVEPGQRVKVDTCTATYIGRA